MASVDDAETNKSFAESLDADFPLLSDPSKSAAAAYGVLQDFGGNIGAVAQRSEKMVGF